MKTKSFLFASSLSFFMFGFVTARAIYGETDIPYLKLLMYLGFGIYFLYRHTNEIKQS